MVLSSRPQQQLINVDERKELRNVIIGNNQFEICLQTVVLY